MGQRFQSVFILPAVYMNAGNCNNRSEKIISFHSQWLYGRKVLITNLAILKRLKEACSKREECQVFGKTKEDFINHFLERSIENSLDWARLQELHNEVRFCKSQELVYSEEEKKLKDKRDSLGKLLSREDNNNGFFICKISQDLKISYAFISGLEDSDSNKQITPKQYLRLFYTDKELKDGGVYEGMQKILKELSKFESIPKEELKPVLKEMA